MAANGPKVTVIGAGSLFFGRQAIWQMVHSPHLNGGTLALVDTDLARLDKLERLANKVVGHEGVPLRIEASTDRRAVLPGSDFVVLSFAKDTVRYRGLDTVISEKYGIRMCSGDTIGPGGVFRAMRELPHILDCARDVEELCPDAWVINYINPSAVNGMALKRFAPQIKSFGLCDSLHMPHVKRLYAERAGVVGPGEKLTAEQDARFDLRIAGVNHFTWVLKAEYDGQDMMDAIGEAIGRRAATETDGGDKGAKAVHNDAIGYQLYQMFEKVPACVAHTKEYVRFWQGHGVTEEAIPELSLWETEARYARHREMWEQIDRFLSGETPIGDYMKTFGPDHATDIIENMVGGLGKPFYINTRNDGAVSNMADDAYLELLCDVDMNGPRPRPVGEMPRGLRAMQEIVLDTHELTAEAVAKGDRALLRRALLVDPLTNSIGDTEALIEDLLDAERDIIPQHWYGGEGSLRAAG
ncbi:glycoside hydrolase family 4 [Devosia geojensis]|uniref:Glycoside hydrolase family 4 n=1 Tax=Devosia geojensis TaxID=443610 RepID=A0A0F5FR54_9HYPH|nr:glycoside hydrolase family 4 [Devosia geojensis]KKB11313.1 glycoside hydrolase family 4 [Devosia geojensis]